MSPDPKRSRGGQPGNKNGFKHGLYSRVLSPAADIDPSQTAAMDLSSEIELLRVLIARATRFAHKTENIQEINACLRAISFALSSLSRIMHVQRDLSTKTELDEWNSQMNQAMDELLEELKAEGKEPPTASTPHALPAAKPAQPPTPPAQQPDIPPAPPIIKNYIAIQPGEPPAFEDLPPFNRRRY